MKNILSKLAEECFQSARITDELCSSTIKKYRYAIRRFEEAEISDNLEDLSSSDFLHYMVRMKERNVSNSSIANIIASVKWVITKLQERGMVFNRLNLSDIKKPRLRKKETNYLTEEEIRRFVDTIAKDIAKNATVRNMRFMAFTMFLLQTGARIGEVLSIDIADIDRHNNEVRVIGKGRKPRTLFLRKETLCWIDRYLSTRRETEPALFATQDGRSRWKQTDVGRSFRRYKLLSGIKKDFVIHTFRHTFATQYLMKGAGINVVQTALGHSDAVTTLKYYAAAVEKSKVREMINDSYFDFIPKTGPAIDRHRNSRR